MIALSDNAATVIIVAIFAVAWALDGIFGRSDD